jgi:hypothetical protein
MSGDGLDPVSGGQPAGPSNSAANGRVLPIVGQPGHGAFTARLQRLRGPCNTIKAGLAADQDHLCLAN